ncbi:MAG: thioredoxin [Anaerolineae bacterium]|nr:MAG: thioredoxin [Anaerolineae bacterium]
MKPVVDGVEAQYQDRLLVIRLNIQEPTGRQLAPLYGFEYTPTFIFFDGQGNELWRQVGSLDTSRLHETMQQIQGTHP